MKNVNTHSLQKNFVILIICCRLKLSPHNHETPTNIPFTDESNGQPIFADLNFAYSCCQWGGIKIGQANLSPKLKPHQNCTIKQNPRDT